MKHVKMPVIVCSDASNYRGLGQNNIGLFLRVDNFVTVSSKNVCDLSKISQFCLERRIKLGCQ